MVLKLLSARPLLGWLDLARPPKGSQQKNKKVVISSGRYNRGRNRHSTVQPLLSGPLYDEDRITSLTYGDKLYKRLPNESMSEFHQRVIRNR